MPNQPHTEREMALLYLLYLARDYIDVVTGGSVPEVRGQIEAELAAVGDEEFWWQYNCAQYEKERE